ncbi:TPA: hypothetical protein P0E36_004925 [Vibrio harveyi]|nr:hypothetical protein [Vibrio harveyi]
MKFCKVDHKKYLDVLASNIKEVERRDRIEGLLSEVMSDLNDGLAHLFMGEQCAAVLRPAVEGDEIVVYVLFGWSTSGTGISDYIDVYDQLARDINAKRIITKTGREGVVRLWQRHGFKRVGIDYDGLVKIEKVLNYG